VWSRSGIITSGIVLAGFFVLFGQSSEVTGTLAQLKETLKQLQAEVKSLKQTLKQLSHAEQKERSLRLSGGQSKKVLSVAAKLPDLEEAGNAYNEAHNFEEQKLYRAALESYSRAIQFDPERDAAFLHRGYCYYYLGESADAIADFVQSLTLQPNNSRAYLARAKAYAATGQISQAMLDVSEAIRREPKNPDGYLLRGLLYQRQEQNQGAIEDYTSALSLAPGSEKALLGRSASLLRTGKLDLALHDCDGALRINPNAVPAYLCRAEYYLQTSSPTRAVDEINRAMLTAESLDQPLAFLNDTWKSMQPSASAVAHLPGTAPQPPAPTKVASVPVPSFSPPPQPAAPQSPRPEPASLRPVLPQPAPQAVLSPPVHSQPPLKQAGRSMVPDGSCASADARRYASLGREQNSRNHFEAAVTILGRAIALDPQLAISYNARGYARLRLHDLASAVTDFSEAIRLRPDYANAYHNRAVARRLLGDRIGAAEDDQKAAKLGDKAIRSHSVRRAPSRSGSDLQSPVPEITKDSASFLPGCPPKSNHEKSFVLQHNRLSFPEEEISVD
jgi:tetratricopeptide (TPR) repeat protein